MGLRELRRQRGLTIEQIAVLADVSTATISRAERGLQNLSPYSVVKISKASEYRLVGSSRRNDDRKHNARGSRQRASSNSCDQGGDET